MDLSGTLGMQQLVINFCVVWINQFAGFLRGLYLRLVNRIQIVPIIHRFTVTRPKHKQTNRRANNSSGGRIHIPKDQDPERHSQKTPSMNCPQRTLKPTVKRNSFVGSDELKPGLIQKNSNDFIIHAIPLYNKKVSSVHKCGCPST